MTEENSYSVKLDMFEGPLDLLFHLIKKNQLDIRNIPIALVTNQYLDYLKAMRAFNLDVAGEYLVLAATLIHIKSRCLIPPEEGELVEDEEDPRLELVEQLLEYQRYKEAAERLNQRDILERDVFLRGDVTLTEVETENKEAEFKEVSIFELISVFRDLLRSVVAAEVLEFTSERFSLVEKVNELVELLKVKKNITFTDLFAGNVTKRAIVQTFMALLEMIRLRLVRVYQTNNFGVIRILSLVEE
ncbi:MAG: segregation/condensation protein A [Deltaproteobacteria bacterium]|nr:segregation/condensation protein A [Deltaproteobacteria bacterium]